MDESTAEASIRWLFFNIILALLPIIITFGLAHITKIQAEWYKVLKDGELYLFSTTMSAASIGALIFTDNKKTELIKDVTQKVANLPQNASQAGLAQTFTICSLVFTLIISTVAFGITSYLKLHNQALTDEKRFSMGSICCALIAAVLGYVTFFMTNAK